MSVVNYHNAGGTLLGETNAAGVRRDYLTDALGSIVHTVDQSAVKVNSYRYKPYGVFTIQVSTETAPRFCWTGETGSLYVRGTHSEQYNRARFYGNTTGRWTTVDPLWASEQAYTYVGGNPTTWTDPSGMSSYTCAQYIPKPRPPDPPFPVPKSKEIPLKYRNQIIIDWITAPGCWKVVRDAGNEARDIPDNAIRHCVWACKIARRSPACAGAERLKEVGEIWGKYKDSVVDLENDRVGSDLGSGLRKGTTIGNCYDNCVGYKGIGMLYEVRKR